jgi:hypothetical protein
MVVKKTNSTFVTNGAIMMVMKRKDKNGKKKYQAHKNWDKNDSAGFI